VTPVALETVAATEVGATGDVLTESVLAGAVPEADVGSAMVDLRTYQLPSLQTHHTATHAPGAMSVVLSTAINVDSPAGIVPMPFPAVVVVGSAMTELPVGSATTPLKLGVTSTPPA
jgi:hypothetical protein